MGWSLVSSMLNSDWEMHIVLVVLLYNYCCMSVLMPVVVNWVVDRGVMSNKVCSILIVDRIVLLVPCTVVVSKPILMVLVMIFFIENLGVERLMRGEMESLMMIMEWIFVNLMIGIVEVRVWHCIG